MLKYHARLISNIPANQGEIMAELPAKTSGESDTLETKLKKKFDEIHESLEVSHSYLQEITATAIDYEVERWRNLRSILQELQQTAGVSQLELKNGLGINRTSISRFLSKSNDPIKDTLPIERINIVHLFAVITNPETDYYQKADQKEREEREKLRKQGLDEFLLEAGYMTNTNSILHIGTRRQQQLRRIFAILDSDLIEDSHFVDIAENVELQVLKSAQDSRISNMAAECKSTPYNLNGQECIDWGETYICESQSINRRIKQDVLKQFKRAIFSLIRIGKNTFTLEENIALFTSVAEKKLNRLANPKKFEHRLRMRSCEFKKLNFSILDYLPDNHFLDNQYDSILLQFNKAFIEAEGHLRYKKWDQEQSKLTIGNIPPTLEAEIICTSKELDKEIHLFYASCSTHLTNMVTAIEYGLGFATTLKPSLISIRSLTHELDGLVRCLVTLHSTNDRHYQGLWIDRDTIISAGQAFIYAAEDWISDTIDEKRELEQYQKILLEHTDLEKELREAIKTIYDHRLWKNNRLSELIEKIDSRRNFWEKETPQLFELYKISFDCLYNTAILNLARLRNIRGNLTEVGKLLDNQFQTHHVNDQYHLILLYEVEKSLYLLSSGKQDITASIQWKKLYKQLFKLQEFVKANNDQDNSYSKYLSYDTYLCASELCGNYGRLAFYTKNNIEDLEEAMKALLYAAHYASRIGLKLRTSRWLSLASRICCRLNRKDDADILLTIAEHIIQEYITEESKQRYDTITLSVVNLAKGELCLLKKNYYQALNYFIKALSGALDGGFTRRVADSLYNLYKVSKHLGDLTINGQGVSKHSISLGEYKEETCAGIDLTKYIDTFQKIHSKWQTKEAEKETKNNDSLMLTAKFCISIAQEKNTAWKELNHRLKEEAQRIWNDWYQQEVSLSNIGQHPVSKMMDLENNASLFSVISNP